MNRSTYIFLFASALFVAHATTAFAFGEEVNTKWQKKIIPNYELFFGERDSVCPDGGIAIQENDILRAHHRGEPYVIYRSGRYCLTENVQVDLLTNRVHHAIQIDASNVILDLNGKSIRQPIPPRNTLNGVAIRATANTPDSIVVKNGFIRNFSEGIKLTGSTHTIEKIVFDNVYLTPIALEDTGNVIVRYNNISGPHVAGIFVGYSRAPVIEYNTIEFRSTVADPLRLNLGNTGIIITNTNRAKIHQNYIGNGTNAIKVNGNSPAGQIIHNTVCGIFGWPFVYGALGQAQFPQAWMVSNNQILIGCSFHQ